MMVTKKLARGYPISVTIALLGINFQNLPASSSNKLSHTPYVLKRFVAFNL
jgi:hypothetical protein